MRLLEETSEILEVKTTPIERDFFVDWKDILGSGCSGHVRYCIELMTGKEFALKILLDNPQSRKEAYMHQQLSGHPHIVSLHRVYHNSISLSEDQDATPKNRLLLVMEMMTGGSLIKRLRREKTDEATVARYMSQIVDAVKYIHGLEIAHRDIKPDNILVSDNTEDAVVKLADFGFAKEDRCGLKSPSFTASYVAPEVIKVVYGDRMSEDIGMQSYDKSCDMWSLGVTMFCLLCKHHPFEYKNEDLRAMIMRILLGNYQFLSEEWNTISEEAKDIVRRLLQVEPSERMTVEELADHPWLKKTYSVASSDVSPSSSFMLTDEESVSPSYSFILTDEERVTHLQSTPEEISNDSTQCYKKGKYFHNVNQPIVTLKSMEEADNPLLRKRKLRLLQVEPSERMTVEELADHRCLRKTHSVASGSTFPSSSVTVTDGESATDVQSSSEEVCSDVMQCYNLHCLNDTGVTLTSMDEADDLLLYKRKRRYSVVNEDSREYASPPRKRKC